MADDDLEWLLLLMTQGLTREERVKFAIERFDRKVVQYRKEYHQKIEAILRDIRDTARRLHAANPFMHEIRNYRALEFAPADPLETPRSADDANDAVIWKGFERVPYPREVFSLLQAGLTGMLDPSYQSVYNSLHENRREWMNLEFMVINQPHGKLILHARAGLTAEEFNNKYAEPPIYLPHDRTCDISPLLPHNPVPLRLLPPEILIPIYGVPYAQLPLAMQGAKVELPVAEGSYHAMRGGTTPYDVTLSKEGYARGVKPRMLAP